MKKELSEFQIRNITLLTHLLEHDAVTDEVVEFLRQSELDYFSLINKYRILEKNINVDEKTKILKFKKDYLTTILKTALRIYYGMQSMTYDITLVRFDIDDFSQFNNHYGHDVGDRVLVSFANLLKANSRPTDYVIRYGGEEIDVILPATNLDGAICYCDKIFSKVRKLRVKSKNQSLKITVSAGISHLVYKFKDGECIEDAKIEKYYKDLQREADNALYDAKFGGKNRYCIYSKKKEKEYLQIRKQYTKKK